MSGILEANTFPKTDLNLNNTQGTSDVVPDPQNKIENNFQWCKCSKISLDWIKGDVLIINVFHRHGWDWKRNEGNGFLSKVGKPDIDQNVLVWSFKINVYD